jgi:hypothetical protein
MKTIPVDTRAAHFKLRPKKYQKPPKKVGMSSEQMRVFGKFHEAAARAIDNLSCGILEPSPEQAQEMNGLLDELAESIESLRCRISGQGRG